MVQNEKFTANTPPLDYRYFCGTEYTYLSQKSSLKFEIEMNIQVPISPSCYV